MKQPINVLMVDDEKPFRENTRKILERNGFQTILSETGHRTILVMDKNRQIQGILTTRDLLERILPAYLTTSKPARVIREQDLFFQMGKHLIPPRLRSNQ